jgi:hypothetical protein
MSMHDNLSGRAAELAHLNDLIRTSLSLADAAIPLLNEQLHALAEMGIDNLELEGPRIYSRTAGWSPAFDDDQIIYAVALTMPGGLGCAVWMCRRLCDALWRLAPRAAGPPGSLRRVRQASANRAGNDSGRCSETDRRTSLMLPRAGSVMPGLLISRSAAA